MVSADHEQRLILRVDYRHRDQDVVTHTLTVSPTRAGINNDRPIPVGTQMEVQLSFPQYFEPLSLQAEVESHVAAAGHGLPDVTMLRFSFRSAEEQLRLAALCREVPGEARLGIRVLLVEDSSMIREMFTHGAEHLSGKGKGKGCVEVIAAADGESAWYMLLDEPYDLAIVDMYLPAMSGATLIEKIRREPKLASLPVISISVGGSAASAAMLGAGADLFLGKPLVLRDLFGTIDRLAKVATRPPIAVSQKRILLVDDSAFMLEMVRTALADRGYEVLTANDLQELEQHAEVGGWNLILLDVQMPEAFGDDVGMVLRAVRGVSAPIYLFSSLDDDELSRRAENAQIDGYISKRLGVDRLIERVGEILTATENQ